MSGFFPKSLRRFYRRNPKTATLAGVATTLTAGYAAYTYLAPKLWEKIEELQTSLETKAMMAVMSEFKSQQQEDLAEEHVNAVVQESRMFVEALLPSLRSKVLQCTNVSETIKRIRDLSKKHGNKHPETVSAWKDLKICCLVRLFLSVYGLSLTLLVTTIQRTLWAKASVIQSNDEKAEGKKKQTSFNQRVKDVCLERSTAQIWGDQCGGLEQLADYLGRIIIAETKDWEVYSPIDIAQLRFLIKQVTTKVNGENYEVEHEKRERNREIYLCNLVVPALNVAPPGGTAASHLIAEARAHAAGSDVTLDEALGSLDGDEKLEITKAEEKLVCELLDQSYDVLESPNSTLLLSQLVDKGFACVADTCKAEIYRMTAAAAGGGVTNVAAVKNDDVIDGSTGASKEEEMKPLPSVTLARLLPRLKVISERALTVDSDSNESKYLDNVFSVPALRDLVVDLYRHSAIIRK
eukprot:g1613.t1